MKYLSVVVILFLFSTSCTLTGDCIKGNCVNGQGTLTIPNGGKYVGEFEDGKYSGQGTWTSPDGAKYVGEFKDGKRNGQGTWTSPDGHTSEVIYECGIPVSIKKTLPSRPRNILNSNILNQYNIK